MAVAANKDGSSSLIVLLQDGQQGKQRGKSHVTWSVVTLSNSFSKSSAMLAAAKACARAEAVHAHSTFAKRETELMVEKANLKVEVETALTTLKQEEEIAAALAKAEILESAVAELGSKVGSVDIAGIPHDSKEKRTSNYVECHSIMRSSQQSLTHAESNTAHNQPQDVPQAPPHHDSKQNGDGLNFTPTHVKHCTSYSRVHSMNQPAAIYSTEVHPHGFSSTKGPQPHTTPLRLHHSYMLLTIQV